MHSTFVSELTIVHDDIQLVTGSLGHVEEALFFHFSIIAHINRVVSIESTHSTDVNNVTGDDRDICGPFSVQKVLPT